MTGSRWEAATWASSEEALTQLDSELGYGASKPPLAYAHSPSVKAPLAYPLALALDPEALTCASSEQAFTFTPTSTSTGARREGIDSEGRAPPDLDSACRAPPFHTESACIHTESPSAGGDLLESGGGQDELMSGQRPQCVEAQVEEVAGAERDKGPGAGGGTATATATALQDKLPLERQKNLCHGCSAHTHADHHLVLPMCFYTVYMCPPTMC